MTSTTPRQLPVLVVTLALAAGACGDKAPRRGWRAPFDVAAAEALVAKCLPGAKRGAIDSPRRETWRLADPGPEGWLTFAISYSFEWKTESRDQLLNVALDASGPSDQQTPDNSARFRAALTCAFSGLPMPAKVGTKALDLLAAIRPPGRREGKRDGFDLTAIIGRFSQPDFYAAVYIFGE